MAENEPFFSKQKEDNELLQFLKDDIQPKQIQTTDQDKTEYFGPNTRTKVDEIKLNDEWINIELDVLPYHKFYPLGTKIFIRSLTTKGKQAFSMINDKNPYDVQLKLNEVLSTCVKIVFIDGTLGTYRDIMDGDRETLTIIISKATSKNSKKIQKPIICDCVQSKTMEQYIEFIPANYEYIQEDEDIKPFFDNNSCTYNFNLNLGINIKLAPPTIGIVEDLNKYILYTSAKSEGKLMPNLTFMQIIPYILAGKKIKSMDIEKFEQEEFNFSKMNDELFEFVFDTVTTKLGFGIKNVNGVCQGCGKAHKIPFSFPGGAKSLFITTNAFNKYISK